MNETHYTATYGQIVLSEGDPDFMYWLPPDGKGEGIRIKLEEK